MMNGGTKKVLAGAFLLASSPAWAKAGIGGSGGSSTGKGALGITHLSLDEIPTENLELCSFDNEGMTGSNIIPNELVVGIDPFARGYMELTFAVSDIRSYEEDYVLFLVYATRLSPSPQMPTPRSIRPVELDLTDSEILAIYHIPKQNLLYQEGTRLGRANSAPRSKVMFTVNLDNDVIPTLMRTGKDTAYMQAALLRAVDYEAGRFENMILSEVDSLKMIQGPCNSHPRPDGVQANPEAPDDDQAPAASVASNDGEVTLIDRSQGFSKTKDTSVETEEEYRENTTKSNGFPAIPGQQQ